MVLFFSRTFNSKNTTTSCLHGAVVVAWVHHKGRQGDLVGNTMKIRISESLKLSCIYVFEQRQWSGYMKRKSGNAWKASAMLLWKRRRTRREIKIIPLAAFFVRLGAWEYQKRFGVQLIRDVVLNTMMQIHYWKPELLQNTEITFFASNNHCILILQYLLKLIFVSWY